MKIVARTSTLSPLPTWYVEVDGVIRARFTGMDAVWLAAREANRWRGVKCPV